MSGYNFDGRVAAITGAGRGIGRAYALLLAERGASVVVNDLGGTREGDGSDDEPAATVAAEIVDAGGSAVADTSDVSEVAGGQALIDAAVDEFGRIDIVVNNAGNIRWAGLPEADADNLQSHLAVHVGGSFNTTRAAWPHMVAQGYGRVVMTTSTGMFGLPDNLGYATAKAAVIGMTRSLKRRRSGSRHQDQPHRTQRLDTDGPPVGWSARRRAAGPPSTWNPSSSRRWSRYLAHERLRRQRRDLRRRSRTIRPHLHRLDRRLRPPRTGAADHRRRRRQLGRRSTTRAGYYVPADLMDWSRHFLAHQRSRPR